MAARRGGLTVSQLTFLVQQHKVLRDVIHSRSKTSFKLTQLRKAELQCVVRIQIRTVVEQRVLHIGDSCPAHCLARTAELQNPQDCGVCENVRAKANAGVVHSKIVHLIRYQRPHPCLGTRTRYQHQWLAPQQTPRHVTDQTKPISTVFQVAELLTLIIW